MRTTLSLAAVGIAIGFAAAYYLVRLLETQLYAIQPRDLPTFLGAGIVMFLVAAFAAYFPAYRAAKIDPIVALRYE